MVNIVEELLFYHQIWSGMTIIVITTLVIGVLLWYKLKQFKSFNPKPEICFYSPKPDCAVQFYPDVVRVGFFVNKFITFNPIDSKFIVDCYVWLAFDPSSLALASIGQFSFENGELLHKSEPETKLLDSGELFAKYKLRLKFSPDLNFVNFPLDDHRIFLTFQMEGISTDEAICVSNYLGIHSAPDRVPSGWKIVDQETYYGFKEMVFGEQRTMHQYPCAVFAFDVAKAGLRKTAVVVLPIVAIFYVSFLTLLILEERWLFAPLIISSAALSALLAYRFVLENIIPPVSYLTVADHIYWIFLLASFVIFAVNIYAVTGITNAALLKVITFIALPLSIMISMYCLYRMMVSSAKQ